MNLITIFSRYPDQEACIEHLENLRWGDQPNCPHCGSVKVRRKGEGERVGRWNCHDCHASFNVLSGTIFHKTRVPLQKWFLAIGLLVNAKKSLSSCQLARDLDTTQPTAWYMQHRIRAQMASDQGPMLQGILEIDETYVGGKPRKANRKEDRKPAKRGRGSEKKTPVIGVVERGGNVAARIADRLTGKAIVGFIRDHVEPAGSLLISDEFASYNAVRPVMAHAVINHSVAYADGETHTNTIESFWSLLKRAWHGSHHHYGKRWMPLFVAEQAWKWNERKNDRPFETFMRSLFR